MGDRVPTKRRRVNGSVSPGCTDKAEPAYSVSGNTEHNPQCSGNGTFCFFCEFENNTESADDPATGLRNLVHEMITAKAEVPVIIKKVAHAYNTQIKSMISWEDPTTEQIVQGPEWTHESIKCHLLHSNEWKSVFSDVIERVFHNIILRQQEHMFADADGLPDPEVHDQFLTTVKTFIQYRKSQKDGV